MAFSENGYFLASGTEDGGANIMDLRKLKCTKTLECTYKLLLLFLIIVVLAELFFRYEGLDSNTSLANQFDIRIFCVHLHTIVFLLIDI